MVNGQPGQPAGCCFPFRYALPRASDLFLDQQQQPSASTALISSMACCGITTRPRSTREPETFPPVRRHALCFPLCCRSVVVLGPAPNPALPPRYGRHIGPMSACNRKGPSPSTTSSTFRPSHRSRHRRERGECILQTPPTYACVFYFDHDASKALPIQSTGIKHCHAKIRGTHPKRTLA